MNQKPKPLFPQHVQFPYEEVYHDLDGPEPDSPVLIYCHDLIRKLPDWINSGKPEGTHIRTVAVQCVLGHLVVSEIAEKEGVDYFNLMRQIRAFRRDFSITPDSK